MGLCPISNSLPGSLFPRSLCEISTSPTQADGSSFLSQRLSLPLYSHAPCELSNIHPGQLKNRGIKAWLQFVKQCSTCQFFLFFFILEHNSVLERLAFCTTNQSVQPLFS
eukprot:c18313_g1_i1 orf=174-503(-)